MIKIILLLILFVSSSFAQNANEVTNATISPGLSSSRNYVKNPSGFKNTLGITVSSATIARDTDTSDKLDGIASLVCDASSQNGYCLWSLDTIQEGDKTGNCEFKVTYKGDASLYKLRITDTSSTLTDSSVLANVTDWTEASINYPCGSTRDVLLVQTESGTGAAVNIGRVYYGKATNIGSTGYVGPWTSWTPTGTLTTNTTYTGRYRVNGDMKDYEVTISFSGVNTQGTVWINLPSGDVIDFNKTDSDSGLLNRNRGTVTYYDNGTDYYHGPIAIQSTTNNQVKLYVYNDDVGGGTLIDSVQVNTGTGVPFTIANGDKFIVNFSLPIVGLGSNTSVDLNCIGTSNCENVFSATVSSIGTVSAENVDWINGNCTNANPLVCTFNTSLFSAVPSCTATAVSGRIVNISAISTSSISIQGVDDAGSATQYGFHIVCSRQSSDLKPRPQVPILVGSISSSATGALKLEYASVESTCSSNPCTIGKKSSDAITSIGWTSTGIYTVNYTGFSSYPVCTVSSLGATSGDKCNMDSLGASSAGIRCFAAGGSTLANARFTVNCIGPK